MNFIKSMLNAIIQSWDAFWETYETTYGYEIVSNEWYPPSAFNYFGDPCFPPLYFMPNYYQTQNEDSQ